MNSPVTSKGSSGRIQSLILADDEADDHDFFCSTLREIAPSIRLDVVQNGQELLELLSCYLPDLLILNLEMPRKNGLECLLEIRRHPQLKALPVVVFSSTTRPANIETAYEMGADLYFVKPATYADLLASLRALLALDWSDPAGVKEQHRANDRFAAFL